MNTSCCIDHKQKRKTYGHSGNALLHRKIFKKTYGFYPDVVMHTCDNPRCINPEHLIAGSTLLNNRDCSKKGRNNGSNGKLRKLSQEEAETIREDKLTMTYDQLQKKYLLSRSNLYNIVKGITYK